jgi:hypothetical protein
MQILKGNPSILVQWVDFMNLEELVAQMRMNPVSLFYGAGVSIDSGGPSWAELEAAVQQKFSEKHDEDFFKLMELIIGYNDDRRSEVESIIKKRVSSISPTERQKYLFSIPWKAVMTTNYDLLPEIIGCSNDGLRQVVTISNPETEVNQEKDEYLYCFKLLGDCQYSYPIGGWMVLSTNDLITEAERRANFFRKFRALSLSGHIIYLGYSFKDNLVFMILSHMRRVLQNYSWTGYAVMPEEPSPVIMEKLKSVGITWVKGDVKSFVDAAKKVFGENPSSVCSDVGTVVVHGQTIELDRSVFSNIRGKFRLLDEEAISQNNETINSFLSGASKTFFPYVWNWDFRRHSEVVWSSLQKRERIPKDLVQLSSRVGITDFENDNLFFALIGIAGCGKSIFSNRLAFDWHQTGNPVLFVESKEPLVDTKALDGLMNEIRDKYLKQCKAKNISNPLPIRWMIIAEDCGPIVGQVKQLWKHLIAVGKPADILLVSRESEAPLEKLKLYEPDAVYRLDDTINEEEKDRFLAHFRRFGIIDEELFDKNIRDREINTSFFALLFSTIHSSRKSIKSLLKEEYDRLDDESKKAYQAVSLIQAYQLEPLVSLITRSQSINVDSLKSRYKGGNLSGLLRPANGDRALFTVQRVVAEAIAETVFRTSDERKRGLIQLIDSVTFGEEVEMRFLENLLNRRIEQDVGPRINYGNKIDLYNRAVRVVRSKPLLIHLGRLETNDPKRFGEARKALKEAHDAYVQGFDERAEHILDAEGRLENAVAENEMSLGQNDKAWETLEEAERKFTEAKIDPWITPHPFTGIARTYLIKAKLAKEVNLKLDLILAAAQECNYLERSIGETSESYVIKTEVTNLLSNMGLNESKIELISSVVGKANGYAYIAEIQALKDTITDSKAALSIVEKGLLLDPLSIWLLRLKASLLRKINPGDHKEIRSVLDDYAAQSFEKFDVLLAFELAKETYMEGRIKEARSGFRDLSRKAENNPRLLTHREPEDRWYDGANPKRVTGNIIKVPTNDVHGRIRTDSPRMFEDVLIARRQDLQYFNQLAGDRVSYEIIFNMLGPEASRIRKV